MASPIILLDQPDDEVCEERGWVEATVSEEEARDVLAPWCLTEDGDPGARPVGPAERVWLAPDHDALWQPAAEADEDSIEFFEFDATDVVPLSREQRP